MVSFARAVVASEIEDTQASLQDVRDVCNSVDELTFVCKQVASTKGLLLSKRLLCEADKRLMRGGGGADKLSGGIRRSRNWIAARGSATSGSFRLR